MKSIQLLIICGIMMLSTLAFAQTYPLVTIRDVQEPTDMGVTDASPLLGDTVRVTGIAATGPRDIWIGARWSFFLVDTVGGPWSSLQIVQHDTFRPATEMPLVLPGDSITVTGVVEEFPDPTPSGDGATQLAVLTNPVTPIEFGLPVSFPRDPFPQNPTLLDMSVLQDTSTGEQYEEVLVRLENVKMLNNDVGGGEALIESSDGVFQISLEDWNLELNSCLRDDSCEWPPNGRPMNIIGYIRDKTAGTPGARYMIAPWSLDLPYIEILAEPPVIDDITRNPAAPSSADAVEVKAGITRKTAGATASTIYSVDNGAWQEVAMTETVTDTFTGTIPAQAEGSLVKYFISAQDDSGFVTISPGDTARSPIFYIVRDGVLMIQDIQYDPFGSGNSGYKDMQVTTTGIVTSDSIQYGNYWIQNGRGPWSGILINDTDNDPVPGDEVEVTGTIREIFGFTRMDDIVGFSIIGSGNPQPEPRVFNAGDINTEADSAEAYEGVLVIINNVTVTDPFPDHPGNFGEFSVGDASGDIRVDDLAAGFNGNNDSVYVQGDSLEFIRGYLYFSFGNFKLAPRDTHDVKRRVIISVRDEGGVIPEEFSLSQNYPNPFNPITELNYALSVSGNVRLVVYNLLGQKVASIVDEYQEAGKYKTKWNGRDDFGRLLSSGVYFYKINVDNGKFVDTKKMLLLK